MEIGKIQEIGGVIERLREKNKNMEIKDLLDEFFSNFAIGMPWAESKTKFLLQKIEKITPSVAIEIGDVLGRKKTGGSVVLVGGRDLGSGTIVDRKAFDQNRA